MPYAVTKAAQLQLVKCLAVTVGPKIRVNTVLPGLLLTEWVRIPFAHRFRVPLLASPHSTLKKPGLLPSCRLSIFSWVNPIEPKIDVMKSGPQVSPRAHRDH